MCHMYSIFVTRRQTGAKEASNRHILLQERNLEFQAQLFDVKPNSVSLDKSNTFLITFLCLFLYVRV